MLPCNMRINSLCWRIEAVMPIIPKVRWLGALVYYASFILVTTLAILPLVAGDAWQGDVVTFFRPHLAAAAFLLFVLSLLPLRPVRIVLSIGLLVVTAIPILARTDHSPDRTRTANLRVMSANLLFDNTDRSRFPREVSALSPDIIVVQEAIPPWQEVLKALPGYPYVIGPQFMRWNGVVVLSRLPASGQILGDQTILKMKLGGGRPLRVEIPRPGGKPLILFAIHPPTPRTFLGWERRNLYLAYIASLIAAEPPGTDIIVAGDWNTPVWSRFYDRFLAQTGLKTTDAKLVPHATRFFREYDLPAFLGSSVDHIAISKGIKLAAFRTGNDVGSDHLPVIADLEVPAPDEGLTSQTSSGQSSQALHRP